MQDAYSVITIDPEFYSVVRDRLSMIGFDLDGYSNISYDLERFIYLQATLNYYSFLQIATRWYGRLNPLWWSHGSKGQEDALFLIGMLLNYKYSPSESVLRFLTAKTATVYLNRSETAPSYSDSTASSWSVLNTYLAPYSIPTYRYGKSSSNKLFGRHAFFKNLILTDQIIEKFSLYKMGKSPILWVVILSIAIIMAILIGFHPPTLAQAINAISINFHNLTLNKIINSAMPIMAVFITKNMLCLFNPNFRFVQGQKRRDSLGRISDRFNMFIQTNQRKSVLVSASNTNELEYGTIEEMNGSTTDFYAVRENLTKLNLGRQVSTEPEIEPFTALDVVGSGNTTSSSSENYCGVGYGEANDDDTIIMNFG